MPPPINLVTSNCGEWFSLDVSNSLVSLSVIPNIGGRVMDLSLGETQVFYSNPRLRGKAILGPASTEFSLGRNYGGSKVWPAPQGWSNEQEWPGPPDPVFDCGLYDWQAVIDPSAAKVHLKSPHDEYSGITMQREIKVSTGRSSVEVLHTMQNTSRRPVRWSIWQVTQVDALRSLEIFIPATGFRQTFGDKPFQTAFFSAAERRVRVKYDDRVAKLAVKADQGWFASLDRARSFVLAETFPIAPAANYPDDAPVAFWISGHGTFTLHGDQVDISAGTGGCDPHIETEIMSPMTDLQPGESSSFRTAWHLASIDAEEIVSVNHSGAIGAPLAVQPGDSTHFTGSFGSFWEATLALVAYDRASQIVGTFDLGEVSPRRPVLLDKNISLPRLTTRCSLILYDRDHNQLGVLDRVNIR